MANPVEQWFRIADEDRDGGVGGAEAVRFFTKSGLPQDVLGQIWEYASGGAAKLNLQQFGVAMRLVTLAQGSGGRLIPEARMLAMGGGPQLPPPRLAGITDAPAPNIPTYTPQITGLTGPPPPGGAVGYTPQPTGGYVAQPTGGYQPQVTGGMRPMGPYASAPSSTGGYTPQATGYVGAGPTGGLAAAGPTGSVAGGVLPGFPPVTPADIQRYQAAFLATDSDRDGLAKGADCFPVFMLSGLDKALLKRMWDLVAGSAGSLTQEQFIKCMYLMDGCRRGAALPTVLPPGPWPQVTVAGPPAAGMTGAGLPQQLPPAMPGQQPAVAGITGGAAGAGLTGSVTGGLPPAPRFSSDGGGVPGYVPPAGSAPLPAESWTLDSQFGHKGAVKAISDAYDQTLPRVPELPGKVTYEARAAAAAAGPSSVPDLDSTVASMLVPADKERWEAERQEVLKKEEQQRQAEADAAAAKARLEAFQTALSELIMFKSRVDVALLQATDSAARLAAEAEETEIRYNKARLAAESQAEEGNAARTKLQALLARKQEAANKLELLQQEISMMANMNPAELAALEKEVGTLVAQMSAAEARKAAMELQLDSGKKQKALLAERMSDLEMAAAAGEGDVRRAKQELAELEAKVATAQAAAQSPSGLGEVGPLLGKAASAYRRLYSSAAAAGLEVPYEANLNNVGSLVWLEQLMAGTADWVDDDDAVAGYTVVNALPDLEGVPPALLRAAAMAAAQQPPMKAAAAAAADTAPAKAAEGAAVAGGAVSAAPPEAESVTEQQQPAPAAAAAKAPGEGAVAAVAATTAAAAAAAGAAVVASAAAKDADGTAATDLDETGPTMAAAEGEQQGAGPSAGFDDNAFGDNAFEDGAFAPAASDQEAAPVPAEQAEPAAATEDPAAVAAAELPSSIVAAELEELGTGADAGASTDGVDVPNVSVPPPGARRSLADEDDSDLMSPLSPGLMSAVQGGGGGDLPVLGGLAGFDPAQYRLDPDQRQLSTQYSIDSSYAGSFAGGAAAGATGASTDLGDELLGGDGSSGQQGTQRSSAALVGFEDNAF